jgi:3D (Asp-Asp-Asp) domain-containing protein
MFRSLRFIPALVAGGLLISCAEQTHPTASRPSNHRISKVRTTAYSSVEKGGHHNAIGEYLSGRNVMSAASDWSRYPLGTRFRIVDTNEDYIIDDYGTALIGTNTIDLYKRSRLEMRRWGVRHFDIEILQWGSTEQSLKVLAPRAKHRSVRQMITGLQKKNSVAMQKKNAVKPITPSLD